MATGSGAAAATPIDRDSWPKRLWRAIGAFRRHQMTDHAASLTFFLVMSLFPALLVAVSLVGFFGSGALVVDAVDYLRDAGAPADVVDPVRASLTDLVGSSGAKAGFALVLGLVLGLNAASGAFGAAGRALNVVYAADEERSFVRRKLNDLGFTLLVLVLGLVGLVSVLLGGTVAEDLFGAVGLGDTAATVWRFARWPIALVAVMVVFGVVYAYAPDLPTRRFRWISPGALAGVVLWLAASALFFLYVSNFGDYGATYGAFTGAIVLLLWLYITSLAFLLGAELDQEVERAETAGRGGPPPVSPPPGAG